MIWLARPPWARWAGAILLMTGALWAEFRPQSTVPHPFATESIGAGDAYGAWNTRVVQVPTDLLPEVPSAGVSHLSLVAGQPILPFEPSQVPTAPDDWWSLEVSLPLSTGVGDEALLVLDDGSAVAGMVLAVEGSDGFLGASLGRVAIPPDHAAMVAAAGPDGVTVLIR